MKLLKKLNFCSINEIMYLLALEIPKMIVWDIF